MMHRVGPVLCAIAALVASLLPPAAARAAGPGDRIAFTADGQIVVLDTGTGARTPLTTLGYYTSVAWSPDGGRLALSGFAGGIGIVAADGSGERALSATGHSPAWSPDGERIAFADSDRIVVVDADGGNPQRLTTVVDGDSDTAPAWSPQGTRLAFLRYSESELGYDLWLVEADGTAPRKVADEVAGAPSEPVWSPDGSRIAFVRAQGGIALAAPDGAAVTEVPGAAGDSPVWSPDGAEIAFVRGEAGVWVTGLDGGGLRQAGDGPGAEFDPTWSPDGTRIAFTAGPADSGCECYLTNVYTTALDGTGQRQLTDGLSERFGTTFSPGFVRRIAGAARIETSVEVSRTVFESATAVVLARADAYPDALAGAPVATGVGGPLLLSGRETLHPAVADEVGRLGATTAYLLGDSSALSAQVEADLRTAGVEDVVRIAGANRYATAAAAATREPGGARAVYVVEGAHADPGRGWPDAVSVSALAAFQGRPILLVERDRLPDETRRALVDLGVTEVTIVGGTAAVSDGVAAAIAAESVTVDRLAGATRYETSRLVAERAAQAGMSPATVWLAAGGNWPDSLAAGPAAAAGGGILLLAAGTGLQGSPPTRDWLADRAGAVARVWLVGGPDVLRPTVAVEAERALG
ncbi:MAG: cell wall-binding repeat-containing protein [Euzebyaceae bacterium]|nr:cell wall-binding repeat-containing protein [Euzebyaceae bacterium]